MRWLVFAAMCAVAEAGCGDSSGDARRDAALAGEWSGQGLVVLTSGAPTYAPLADPGTSATSPMLASFQFLNVTADDSGGFELVGLPVAGSVPMELLDGGLVVSRPFTVTGPAPSSCAGTPCDDQSASVTVTGGWAAVSDGNLSVALTAEQVVCCHPATFTVAFVGTRASR